MNLPSGREPRAPARPRPAVLRVAASACAARRCGSPTCSATRPALPQIFRPAGATGSSPRSCQLEQAEPLPALARSGGRASTAARVLTHFPPVDTYNAEIVAERGAPTPSGNFREHGWSDWSLMPFGHGDGGGGPTREMLERAARLADLDGVPPVALGHAERVLRRGRGRGRRRCAGAGVGGELYFEMHRGTLTSQSRTKVGNRRCERLLREAELWWAAGGACRPRSSTRSTRRGRRCCSSSSTTSSRARRSPGCTPTPRRRTPASAPSWRRRSPTPLARLAPPGQRAGQRRPPTLADEVVAVATTSSATADAGLADGRTACSCAVAGLGDRRARAPPIADRVVVTERSMANGRLAVSWDLDGDSCRSSTSRAGRELLPGRQRGVVLELAPDHPVRVRRVGRRVVDAGRSARRSAASTSVEVVDAGPLVAALRVRAPFGARRSCSDHHAARRQSPRLDLHVRHRLARGRAAAVAGVPARRARRRRRLRHPVRHVAPPDAPAHAVGRRQVRGVRPPLRRPRRAVVRRRRAQRRPLRPRRCSDGARARVSLAARRQVPRPDRRPRPPRVSPISVLPHGPGLHDGASPRPSALNVPLRRRVDGSAAARGAAGAGRASITGAGVEVDAVKRADDGSGDLVVRLARGVRRPHARSTCAPPAPIARRRRCNLLEEPTRRSRSPTASSPCTVRPFELVTLRLRRSATCSTAGRSEPPARRQDCRSIRRGWRHGWAQVVQGRRGVQRRCRWPSPPRRSTPGWSGSARAVARSRSGGRAAEEHHRPGHALEHVAEVLGAHDRVAAGAMTWSAPIDRRRRRRAANVGEVVVVDRDRVAVGRCSTSTVGVVGGGDALGDAADAVVDLGRGCAR